MIVGVAECTFGVGIDIAEHSMAVWGERDPIMVEDGMYLIVLLLPHLF